MGVDFGENFLLFDFTSTTSLGTIIPTTIHNNTTIMAGSKKVLMLGAGFVTKPTLDILSDAGIEVSVACRTLESAKKLSSGVKNAIPISLDVTDPKALDAEVAKNDLVISLIPYTFHATVIESAIRNKKHVVTTSYVSPAMLELDAKAKEAGITVMNEIGLDPGIDHLQGHRGEEPPYGRSQLGWDLLRREDHSPRQPTRHSLRNPREEDAVRGGRARFRHAATQVRDREQGWQ